MGSRSFHVQIDQCHIHTYAQGHMIHMETGTHIHTWTHAERTHTHIHTYTHTHMIHIHTGTHDTHYTYTQGHRDT